MLKTKLQRVERDPSPPRLIRRWSKRDVAAVGFVSQDGETAGSGLHANLMHATCLQLNPQQTPRVLSSYNRVMQHRDPRVRVAFADYFGTCHVGDLAQMVAPRSAVFDEVAIDNGQIQLRHLAPFELFC